MIDHHFCPDCETEFEVNRCGFLEDPGGHCSGETDRCMYCNKPFPPECEICPECEKHRPDDDRVKNGMKCESCAYAAGERR